MGEGVEVWRGGVAAWECDTMDHLNVGFYVAKALEGLAGLAAELGMPAAFAPHAETTLILREQHIRFLREARVGARLHMEGGVLEMGEDDARLLLLMRHAGGELAATFQMLVSHATAREGRAFPWPDWARARAEQLRIELPDKAGPRTIAVGSLASRASLALAVELGLKRTGKGVVRPAESDPFGRLGAEHLMARLSDCGSHIVGDLLTGVADGKAGGVVLEYRFVYSAWPRTGEHLEIRSGWADAEPRLRRMVHWILDPITGRPWAAAEAALAAFDLKARKLIVLSDRELAAWRAEVAPDLTI